MTRSIGSPRPDGDDRKSMAAARRERARRAADHLGAGITRTNGEETAHGSTYPLSYHKGLPHDVDGSVHPGSYHDMVRAVTLHDHGGLETLPLGANRTASGSPTDPPRYTSPAGLKFRKLTSPLTGHVYDLEGADAGSLAISEAPLVASDELAAEMAELYVMALCRDATFGDIASGAAPGNIAALVAALGSMAWFAPGGAAPADRAAARRFASRAKVTSGSDLFRGSTVGSQAGGWTSQYLLIGSDNSKFDFVTPGGAATSNNQGQPSFVGVRAPLSREDGFVLFGTQIIDQRSIVAREGIDYMTNWAAWLDAQNGVDFNDLDVFRSNRRYLSTPRDIATYVHYDALYQAYLVACLLMLGDSASFPKDPGLPETKSRTRAAFASFGGPHVLSLLTEVATRALKAVWRQKWMHHRRARPEVIAALLTLHEHDPNRVVASLQPALAELRAKIPQVILDAVAAHNTAQNAATPKVQPLAGLPAGFPAIADAANHLLPMAFPEGSPTHPAYGAGHATVAGACVTVLKALFDTADAQGGQRPWPYPAYRATIKENEGGELVPDAGVSGLTVTGELDKLAANVAIARNMAGVHYYTDYFESVRLGERIAASILEEQMGLYDEPVSVGFTSFDGEHVSIVANGGAAQLRVAAGATPVEADAWYGRYSS
ncbi:MAG: vanadium-dependent haloperoxidase [Acidimicrobiia bacterium]|nr:vanadium-dependent haloperoxidase [Acidimicrobiia bacterium]